MTMTLKMAETLPRWSGVASLWPLDPGMVFLNHGSFGSCPRWVLEQQRAIVERLEHEPIRFIVEDLEALLDDAREELARFLGADAAGLAFVSNATAGVNTVLGSLRFERGDELLTNDHEYNACNNALEHAAERWGAKVVRAALPFPLDSVAGKVGGDAGGIAERILAAVTERTRLVMLSHITSPTGLVFPVEQVCRALRDRGIETLVDGAHAPGMVPLDLRSLGATYYTGNCHKWLCAPKGAAFLWVDESRRGDIRPLVISHGANSTRTDRSRLHLEFDYTGTVDFSAWLCVPLAIRYMASLDERGWVGIRERNRAQALEAQRVICRVLGMPSPGPDGMIGAMASVELPARRQPGASNVRGLTTPALQAATKHQDVLQDRLIARHRVQLPIFAFGPAPAGGAGQRRLARVAMQLYNTIEQVEYAADAIAQELEIERRGGSIYD